MRQQELDMFEERAEPYSPDERRVVEWLVKQTGGAVGAGNDPIGFLMASYVLIREERNSLREAAETQYRHRITELLLANNREVERRRAAINALRSIANINNGPDKGSAEWRADCAAELAREAIRADFQASRADFQASRADFQASRAE